MEFFLDSFETNHWHFGSQSSTQGSLSSEVLTYSWFRERVWKLTKAVYESTCSRIQSAVKAFQTRMSLEKPSRRWHCCYAKHACIRSPASASSASRNAPVSEFPAHAAALFLWRCAFKLFQVDSLTLARQWNRIQPWLKLSNPKMIWIKFLERELSKRWLSSG
jgi:hypothetical protein